MREEKENRDDFIGWIADRFQQRHAPHLPRDEAIDMATCALEGFEDMETVKFGDPEYCWHEADAHDLADEEIHAGWESVS